MAIEIRSSLKFGNTFSNLARLQTLLDKTTTSANALSAALLGAAQSAGAAGKAVSGVKAPRAGSGPSGGGTAPARQPKAPKPPRFDPFANDPRAGQAYFARGAAAGNPFAAKLYGRYSSQFNSLRRNQANAQNFLRFGGSNNPLSSLFSQALGSTRFGRSGGQVLGHVATSLMGSPGGASFLQGLLGPGTTAASAAGSVGAGAGGAGLAGMALEALTNPLTIVVAGLIAFAAVVSKGAEVMNEWNASLARGGGSAGQARSASALGGSLGVDLAGVGANLSGYAAARLGLNPYTGALGGDVNFNARGLRVVDDIRHSRTRDEARRKAILAGNPDLSRVFDYSQGTYDALRNQPSGGFQGNAGMLSGAQARLSKAWDNLIATFSGPGVKLVSKVMENVAEKLELFNKALIWILDHLPKAIQNAIGYDPSQKNKDLKENTDALNDNTKAYREGISGGGPRASGATPSELRPGLYHPGDARWRNAQAGIL